MSSDREAEISARLKAAFAESGPEYDANVLRADGWADEAADLLGNAPADLAYLLARVAELEGERDRALEMLPAELRHAEVAKRSPPPNAPELIAAINAAPPVLRRYVMHIETGEVGLLVQRVASLEEQRDALVSKVCELEGDADRLRATIGAIMDLEEQGQQELLEALAELARTHRNPQIRAGAHLAWEIACRMAQGLPLGGGR